jgi:uncharacterized SAM-binding protein YcdF (DUF218 family)
MVPWPWFVLIFVFVSCHSSRRSESTRFTKVELSQKERLITGRLFPTFELLNENGADPSFGNTDQHRVIAADISKRYEAALRNCQDGECLARAFSISTVEMKSLKESALNQKKDKKAARQGLQDGILAVNYIFDIYLAGKKPRYPKIDGASFANNNSEYLEKVKQAVSELKGRRGADDVFYGLPWLTALKLLELNGRDEAARYEPLGEINREAYKKVRSINWDKYEFSAILVPGLGPQTLDVPLDPGGAKRCDLAASLFRKGKAPFIIVSGGHVHPEKTPYSEAIEMRNYLISVLKIPAEAVIAEPYARHTTTNIRNASRLVFALDMPSKKPVLVATDFFQTTYIPMMKNRFMDELGYLPYKEISKAGAGVISFIPDISALKLNPLDPLDP